MKNAIELNFMRLGQAALLICALCAQTVNAQTVKMYGTNDKPSAQEIADILANSLRNKTRGVRLTNGSEPAASSSLRLTAPAGGAAAQATSKAEPDAFSLPVQFAFDSARLLPAAFGQLDAVAEAMKLLEGSIAIVIEGHTDAHGKADYNAALSQRRADSVRRYLADKHKIDLQLLKVEGKGANDPINKQNPYAGENRRVQFRAG
jgi:outer membrane protein OmpA-like peptidoglycan-associated protein